MPRYLSTLDKKEAQECVAELAAPADFMPKLVEAVLEAMMNSLKDKEAVALEELLMHLHIAGVLSAADVEAGLRTFAGQLEDLALDVPKAPKLLGGALGAAVLNGVLPIDAMPRLLDGESAIEPKREFAAEAFKRVAAGEDAAKLRARCEDAGVAAAAFLTADELDGPDVPSVEDWLKSEGLVDAVPM